MLLVEELKQKIICYLIKGKKRDVVPDLHSIIKHYDYNIYKKDKLYKHVFDCCIVKLNPDNNINHILVFLLLVGQKESPQLFRQFSKFFHHHQDDRWKD
jgi:hypothetical protein